MRKALKNLKKVFIKPGYVVLTLIIALLFYELNVIIANWSTISSFLSNSGLAITLKILPTLSYGFKEIIAKSSFVTLIIVSILFGILFSLITYKTKMNILKKCQD